MRIFMYADEQQITEIRGKPKPPNVEMVFSTLFLSQKDIDEFDAFFLLKDDYILKKTELSEKKTLKQEVDNLFNLDFKGKEVILHSVGTTLADAGLPDNFSRINAWPGFLERDIWEIALHPGNITCSGIFNILGWRILQVKDEPGLVAARVIAMIINEAFFTLKDGISTPREIDLAMRMGTNYPLGPFEWANKIGISPVFDLLLKLSKKDKAYTPSFERNESYSKSN